MFLEFYRRELAQTFRRPAFYVLLIPMAAMVYAFAANDDPTLTIMMNTGRTWRNSPLVVARLFASLSQFALLFSVLFTGRAIASDFAHRIDSLLFVTPMRKGPYLFGRFAAGLTACIVPFLFVPIALAIGSARVAPEIAGPFRPAAVGLGLLMFVLPNVLFISAVLFGLATWKRGMRLAYIAAVVMWGVFANARFDDVSRGSSPEFVALLDPTGVAALRCMTQFWSVERQNAELVPWDGLLLSNRVLWLTISAGILFTTYRLFRLVTLETKPRRAKASVRPSGRSTVVISHPAAVLNPIAQLVALVRRETSDLVLKPWMLLPLVLAIAAVASNGAAGANDAILYLTAARTAAIVTTSLQPYIIPLTIFFAGVVVWRERDRRMAPLIDSAPIRNWMVMVSKIAALLALQVGLQVAGLVVGISRQWRWDQPLLDLMTYASVLGIDTVRNAQLAVVSVFLQTISRNKYAGFVVTGFVAAIPVVIERVEGFPRLLAFRSLPNHFQSDLLGYGPYAAGIASYLAYWSLASVVLGVAATTFHRRGLHDVREAHRESLGSRRVRIAWLAATSAFVLTGLVLFAAHASRTTRTDDAQGSMAIYERRYQRLETMPTPSTKLVTLDVTVQRREVRLLGTYDLVNETGSDIHDVYVTLTPPEGTDVGVLTLAPAAQSVEFDSQTGTRRFRLAHPWRRGDRGQLRFALNIASKGIREDGLNDDVLDEAVLLSGSRGPRYFPVIGFDRRLTLRDPAERSRAGLPPSHVAMPNDGAGPMLDSRAIVETIIRANPTVAAVAPGELISRIEDGGRIVHRYRTRSPILMQASMAIACGNLTRTEIAHRDLRIELFFDARHDANLQSMVEGIERAYDHCVRLYGPYPQSTIRVVEVPSRQLPEGTARAFAGLIAVREDGGFLTDLRDPASVDTVFSTLAHEMAHQWWPFQYAPTMSRGAEVLVETLPQWTRLIAMEQQWGREKTRRFLESELSAYLRGRAGAREREQPLSLAAAPYLVYRKGSIVLSALRARLGEAAVDRALTGFAAEIAKNPRAATTGTLRAELMRVGAPEQRTWIAEQLDQVILYELNAEIASSRPLRNGRTLIDVRLASSKFEIGTDGAERRLAFSEPAELAICDGEGKVIALETVQLTHDVHTVSLSVPGKPVHAELDPWITRLTREPRTTH